MKTKSFIFSLIFITSSAFSQPSSPEDVMISPFWNFYSDNYLSTVSSGRGYTGIGSTGDISSSSLNPASFEIQNKYQAELQYTYKTSQPWLRSMEITDLSLTQNLFSLSAGFGMKMSKHFQAGVIYNNPASFALDLGEIIRTDEFGNEIGRYEGYERITQHSFSVPLVYSVDKLRIGAAVNFTVYRNSSNMTLISGGGDNEEYYRSSNRLNGQIGLLYTPLKNLSVGATFVPKSTGYITSSNVGNEIGTVKTDLPMKIGAGASYVIVGSGLRLFADYTFTKTSVREDFKDQQQIHAGADYMVNKELTIRGGLFTYPDPRDLSTGHWGNPQDDYNQVFLTLGASYILEYFSVNIALLDSHVSPGIIKNTYLNAGITANF